uniref:Uncharacterized protein n=1 Tax=Pelusios castaneus TaxID=367368 RepID=A0A8C8RME7_9SAUR
MSPFSTGASHSETASSCSSLPCENGGSCVEWEGGYRCLCPQHPASYMGTNCELLYDACAVPKCPSGWTCSATPGLLDYECTCGPGVPECSVNTDPCGNSPCKGPHFECVDRTSGYVCECRMGPNGEGCHTESPVCSSHPCQNNGTCTEHAGEYACSCPPGHSGARCEDDIDECASSPCQNGAICLDRVNEYNCFCVPGFQGYRINCENEIDECDSDPCQNGGVCADQIGLYTCSCAPGYEGIQCEVDIDDCESHPCINGGTCHDLVDSYWCDCSDTGYEGEHCELEILECASQPCLNNATCLEGVTNYSCACWPGEQGTCFNCSVNIDECASEPCQNGGRCTDLVNGFLCHCLPGYSGKVADGVCGISGPRCCPEWGLMWGPACHVGEGVSVIDTKTHFLLCCPGVECAVNIDECRDDPCENGATCEDAIADYICYCAPSQDGILWGGKNCSVALTGCQSHDCQNQALCIPTYQAETHGHICRCQSGFSDATCSTPTTFSIGSRGSLLIDVSMNNNQSRRDMTGDHPAMVSLRFRTTLPDAILFYRGHDAEYLFLELSDGMLHVGLKRNGAESPLLLEGLRVDDGQWHKAEVLLQQSLELKLWHKTCDTGVCLKSSPIGDGATSLSPAFLKTYIGGVDGHLMANNTQSRESFIGCLEDLQIDDRAILPLDIPHHESALVELGCNRTEWCHIQPCSHNGRCVDLWATFRCDCSRPYKGQTCSHEYPAGTFGLEDLSSFASFTVADNLGANFNISFFIRTLKPSGLVLQIRNGTNPCLTVYLKNGQLQLETLSTNTEIFSENLADGRRYLVTLTFQGGEVHASHSDRVVELGHLIVIPLLAGFEVYVGGLPHQDHVSTWGGYFKGCLQDLQLNHHRMEFFPPQAENYSLPPAVFVGQGTNLALGCISDDTCKSGPCHNGGTCTVTWNDFSCSCPGNFTGATCEERVCVTLNVSQMPNAACLLTSGLANATFQGNAAIEFVTNASLTRALSSLHLDFRTRDEDAILLWATKEVDFLQIAIQNSTLLVDIRSGNSIEGITFRSQTPIADGAWHRVSLTMEEPSALSSRWQVHVDGFVNVTLQGNAGNLDFLKNNALIILAENFTGCLGHVNIGGVYLPFTAQLSYPQPEQFLQSHRGNVRLGCTGADVCTSNPCLNGGTCEDLFNSFRCACSAGWEGPRCASDLDECRSSPCVHGDCVDSVADFQCECFRGYIGKTCAINVDDCVRHQCLNGGTCVDGVYSYSCRCPENVLLFQLILLPFSSRCQININECEPNPCQNGGTCQDSVNKYECVCSANYNGERCDSLSNSSLVGAVGAAGAALLLAGVAASVITMKRRRATQGTYSPSRQEKDGARVELWNVIKLPPTERLI